MRRSQLVLISLNVVILKPVEDKGGSDANAKGNGTKRTMMMKGDLVLRSMMFRQGQGGWGPFMNVLSM